MAVWFKKEFDLIGGALAGGRCSNNECGGLRSKKRKLRREEEEEKEISKEIVL